MHDSRLVPFCGVWTGLILYSHMVADGQGGGGVVVECVPTIVQQLACGGCVKPLLEQRESRSRSGVDCIDWGGSV